MDLKDASIGSNKVARIYHRDAVVFPKPIQEDLVLWYDFMGRKNTDEHRDVAQDLSGNGNDGELVNFAFEEGSGYVEGGLRFDGVDDKIMTTSQEGYNDFTIHALFKPDPNPQVAQMLLSTRGGGFESTDEPGVEIRVESNALRYYICDNEGNFNYFSISRENNEIIFLTLKRVGQVFSVFIGLDIIHSEETLLSGEMSDSLPMCIGERAPSWSNGYPLAMDLFSMMRYNRALTATEIAHNYAIEKERWNI